MNFESISNKVKQLSKTTVDEVQKLNEIRQLKSKVSDAQKQIDKIYLEIGKKIYDQYKEAPMAGMESEIVSITEKFDEIEDLKQQICDVKGVVPCPCCGAEVGAKEKFCSNCGNKMPEVEEEEENEVFEEDPAAEESTEETAAETAEVVEEAANEMAEEIKDAAAEVIETVEEKAEEIKEAVAEAAEDAAE